MHVPIRIVLVVSLWLGSLLFPMRAQSHPPTGAPHDNHLCWQQGRRLTWSDFRAPECYSDGKTHASLVAATTAASIPVISFVNGQGQADYHVTCLFLRDSSWVNPRVTTAAARAHTLAHEQLHFDTAELIARKIRCCIGQHRAAGNDLFGPAVVADIQCLLDEYAALSDLYDEDVNFRSPAVEAAAQHRWTLQLARELHALARYQSTAATCSQ